MRTINKRLLYIIPLILIEMMIQMAFFWLVPDCRCKWVVYAILTIATVVHLVISYVLVLCFEIRRTAATIVAGSVVQFMIIAASIYLWAVNASARNALFMLLIILTFYIVIMTLFGFSIEGVTSRNEGIAGTNNPGPAASTNKTSAPTPNHRRTVNCSTGNSNAVRKNTTPPPLPARH